MSGSDLARVFLDSIDSYGDDTNTTPPSQDRPVKLAIVDPAYTGVGRPRVQFEGETTIGSRTYVALARVVAGDRVALLPVGRSYVILGPLTGLKISADDVTSGALPLARGGTGVSAASIAALKAALGIPFAEAAGSVTAPAGSTIVTNVQYANVAVVFPVDKFTVPPIVSLGGAGNGGSVATGGFTGPASVTATGFVGRVISFSTSALPAGGVLHWQAKQMTATTAEG